jgi:hypothetical protein
MAILADELACLLIKALRMSAKDVSGVDGQGIVDVHRHRFDLSLGDHLVQIEDEFLRPANGERRDDHLAASGDGSGDNASKGIIGLLGVVVRKIPRRTHRPAPVGDPALL